MELNKKAQVHPSAEVSDKASIGEGTKVWHQAQIRENTSIGQDCVISKNVYIDHSVKIGNKVKVQNNCSIYQAFIEDGVFIGPHVCFTNDKVPRAVDIDGNPKSGNVENKDWKSETITIKEGASVGAAAVLLPGITIGKFAMIGSGSVVTKDIPDFALAYGNPAQLRGYVCKCGEKLEEGQKPGENCGKCKG